jgi:tetratricopeptide (TPR) repeat protein
MRTFRKITISVTAVMLFIAAPGAHAQEQKNLELMQTFLSIMTDYFEIIESTHDIASDPEKAAIMQMQKIQEVYEQRGEKVRSTDVLKQVLEDSDNTAIRNAAYMLLGDTLKDSGRADEAIELLRQGLNENIAAVNR